MIDPDQSPWVEDWTDQKRRERYQYWAKEQYEEAKAMRDFAFKSNVEYGKWLLASGLAVHGGAIYAINALKSSVRQNQLSGLLDSAAWNMMGLAFVLIAGFSAWLNFQCAANIYDQRANPLRVYKTDALDGVDENTDPINATRFLAIGCGFLSLFSLASSAINLLQTLRLE